MSNLKVLSWLEFLNTVQGCFQPPQYSPFWESFRKHKGGVFCACLSTGFISQRELWGGGRWDLAGSPCLWPSTGVWENPLSPSLWGRKRLLSQCFCPRYIPFISEFLTCGKFLTLFFNSASGRYMKKKVHGLSAQWRNFSRIWNNIAFIQKFFCFRFLPPTPHHSPLPPQAPRGVMLEWGIIESMHLPLWLWTPSSQHWNYWVAVGKESLIFSIRN